MHESDIKFFLPKNKRAHLDVGSNVGELLDYSHKVCMNEKLFGVEINKNAVATAKDKFNDNPNYNFHHGSADKLPFSNGEFDIVTCSEVLEHIPKELRKNVIKEIRRTIKEDGIFIITVPHKGLFHFIDPSNMRFIFPAFINYLTRLFGGVNRDAGFVGEKHSVIWHHHFTLKELKLILEPEFEITLTRWRGFLLTPIIEWILFPLYRWGLTETFIFKFLKSLQSLEFKYINNQFLGYNILLTVKPK